MVENQNKAWRNNETWFRVRNRHRVWFGYLWTAQLLKHANLINWSSVVDTIFKCGLYHCDSKTRIMKTRIWRPVCEDPCMKTFVWRPVLLRSVLWRLVYEDPCVTCVWKPVLWRPILWRPVLWRPIQRRPVLWRTVPWGPVSWRPVTWWPVL